MKILVAPDKFKGSLSAEAAADAMAQGIRRVMSAAEIDLCPMADGGEGTVAVLVAATGGTLVTRRVTGPLPDMKVDATFGFLGSKREIKQQGSAGDNSSLSSFDSPPPRPSPGVPGEGEQAEGPTAVIEMSAASGLMLLKAEDRNPLNTTTFGTGELINAAIEMGARRIILGIGGSATVDAGIGCAQATGHTIVVEDGQVVAPTEPLVGRDLARVVLVKRHRGETTDGVEIIVACDVANPLLGPEGAARVFGPQKGATPPQVAELDTALGQLAARLNKQEIAQTPGAGAAGGLGFALLAFYGATLRPGIDIIIEAAALRQRLRGAGLCLTGEGRLDAQSLHGKTAIGVARVCKEQNVPCIAIAGSIADDFDAASVRAIKQGLAAWFAIADGPRSLEYLMHQAAPLLMRASANIVRLRTAK